MRGLLPILFIGLAACGDVPSDAIPVTMPNDPVRGIYRTTEVGDDIGRYGSPSHGGHASGISIPCAPGTEFVPIDGDVNIAPNYRLLGAYPNPVFNGGSFVIYFTISCRSDVTIEVVEATPSPWILASMPMNTLVATGQGRTVWKSKRTDLSPGYHSTSIYLFDPDKPVNGFFRVYVVAGKFKAWRDVAVFQDPCLMPMGLDFRCGL